MARAALGRGLSALIREPEAPPQPQPSVAAPVGGSHQVDIDLIDPSPYQPRLRFREDALEELARSIRTSGIIQPLILRSVGQRFQLVAGERRWRAAQRAGLQREDLNPIEQARAFERLMSEFHLTQEEVAERTSKDRATVANTVRLLKLEAPLQDLIEEGRLTAGHGRALLSFADAKLRAALAKRAARGALTVRQLERLASRRERTNQAAEETIDPNVRAALEDLQRALGTRVFLRPHKGKRPGQLVIEYYDEAQLMGLYDRLTKL